MRRFVLTATHDRFGDAPVIAAILELGDEAPFCRWRDDLLGLSPDAAARWFHTQPAKSLEVAAQRLQSIRSCIWPTTYPLDVANAPCSQLVEQKSLLEVRSRGRSLASEKGNEELKDQKRLIYALRLARGEHYLRNVSDPQSVSSTDPDFGAGARALHDLMLPRIHMEATVCGAVPPFSDALGGKLIAAFLSHPSVLRASASQGGELLGWSFDLQRLNRFLPAGGLLCLTTKGLYAGHAAIYNRAEMPGWPKRLRLTHLANTEGTTTSLISSRTAKLARLLLESGSGPSSVSQVYGSGGAKRHRAIEAALGLCGLPSDLANAGIRRPVYGVTFARDPAAVVWAGDAPDMLVDTSLSPEDFAKQATELWRSKWLERAARRAREYALVPSLTRTLLESVRVENDH